MRIRTTFVGVDAHIDPCSRHNRFYETLQQKRAYPTGGQRRPPLQNVSRFRRRCVQFCDCILPGRCGHRPLQTHYEVAGTPRALASPFGGGVRAQRRTERVSNAPTDPLSRLRRQLSQRESQGTSADPLILQNREGSPLPVVFIRSPVPARQIPAWRKTRRG